MGVRYNVRLSRHASTWNNDATRAIVSIQRILGRAAADIQHIGSTAVRGILAIPIIDIAVGLSEKADVAKALSLLARGGYRRIAPDETGCIRMAYMRPDGTCDAQRLWITRAGSKAWNDLIAFRDYLNCHVFAANEYEELKRRMMPDCNSHPAAYAAAKSSFVQNILRLSFTDQFLGKRLTIVIDRPIGSSHPEHPEMKYELNYGFVPGIPAPDGENLDAYIYGVTKPLHRFTGVVVAIIHRKNDNEDKLVVAPGGTVAYEPQIMKAVDFAEKHFETNIICIYEKSCGGILYRVRDDGVIEYLVLFQHRSGTWSLPKGHIAAGETEKETAIREIREETGLNVTLIDGFRREHSYTVSPKASKNVVLFLAEAKGKLKLGANEISDYMWAEKSAAIHRLGGRNLGKIMDAAEVFIRARLEENAKRN